MIHSHVILGRLLHICLDNPTQAEHHRSKIDLTFLTSLFLHSQSQWLALHPSTSPKQHLSGFTSTTIKTPSSLGAVSYIFCFYSFCTHLNCCLFQGCIVLFFISITAFWSSTSPYSLILLAMFLCSRPRLFFFWNANLTIPWLSLPDTGQIPSVRARAWFIWFVYSETCIETESLLCNFKRREEEMIRSN